MSDIPIQNLKSQQRLLLKKQIAALSSTEREARSQALHQNLKESMKGFSGQWGAFHSLPAEPHVQWSELNSNIRWYFVETSGQNLFFKNENEVVQAQALDGICIPALGFNVNGARLGRGGGFYDRELQNYKGNKVGIAYDFAVKADIPFETHDIKVDVIVTDRRIVDAA